jgi:hypothetical protein
MNARADISVATQILTRRDVSVRLRRMASMLATIEIGEREILDLLPAQPEAEKSFSAALDLVTLLGSELASMAQALD